jgi:hypothetical protein
MQEVDRRVLKGIVSPPTRAVVAPEIVRGQGECARRLSRMRFARRLLLLELRVVIREIQAAAQVLTIKIALVMTYAAAVSGGTPHGTLALRLDRTCASPNIAFAYVITNAISSYGFLCIPMDFYGFHECRKFGRNIDHVRP